MKNLKVAKKLLITFGIIIILLVITVVTAISSLFSTSNNFTQFYESPYVVTNKTAALITDLEIFAKYFSYSTMTSDEKSTAEYIQKAQDHLQNLREGTVFLRESFSEATSLIDEYDNLMKGIITDRDTVLELALSNRNEEACQIYFDKVMPVFLQAKTLLQQMSDMADTNADGYYSDSISQRNATVIMLLLLAILALGITIFLSAYMTRGITKPVKEIANAAKEVSGGNLQAAIEYQSRDEFGELADSMRLLTGGIRDIIHDIGYIMKEMSQGNFRVSSKDLGYYVGDYKAIVAAMRDLRDTMNNTLLQINQSAEQVSSGSEQVSSGAQALSQGATEQASSIEELAATINEISQQVESTADNATEARARTAESRVEVDVCNKQMQEMITAMGEISQRSGEIGKIIKTIEDIAFQTNILALNAAVEAARAGEAGKGFAVVADEVRNLASKSAEASKNTGVLIEGTVTAVETGTKLANGTAEALQKVVESAQSVTAIVEKIAEAATNQARSIGQVTQGVDQISSVVQTNSATAEESAAASEELSGQAEMLKEMVEKFRLLQADQAAAAAIRPKAEQYAQPVLPVNAGKY